MASKLIPNFGYKGLNKGLEVWTLSCILLLIQFSSAPITDLTIIVIFQSIQIHSGTCDNLLIRLNTVASKEKWPLEMNLIVQCEGIWMNSFDVWLFEIPQFHPYWIVRLNSFNEWSFEIIQIHQYWTVRLNCFSEWHYKIFQIHPYSTVRLNSFTAE